MSLTELWLKTPQQLADKHVRQVVSFAGTGRLKDANDTSNEYRDFLGHIPSALLGRYTDECLAKGNQKPFQDGGLVLQDLISEAGCVCRGIVNTCIAGS